MMPSRVTGGFAQSSSSSGIFFQGEGQSQVEGYSQMSSNFGNSLSSMPGRGHMRPHSINLSNTMFNNVPSSGPSVGASSLVTDANSGISAGPHLQRSASINTESYMRLPASPLSFSSNNISISGSSVVDGSSGMQNPNQDLVSKQILPSQQVASSATSSRIGQIQLPGGPRIPNSYIQDSITISQLQKKPRLDIKREDVLEQQIMQQLMQRQDSMPLQSPNPQWQALVQQQRLRQQQQQLQSMPQVQRTQFWQQQLRQQLLQHGQQSQPASGTKRPVDGGLCSRRLQQYLYHQRQRPTENVIAYWKKFVAEYYSPRAKKKYCLSHYENVGHNSVGVFPQSAMEAWQCDICGSKSGRGFEATFQVLARLNEVNFGSGGVIEELMFLDLPRECRHPSGLLTLEYARAVQECVYEQSRVVREGQLRIIFTPDLKILSWEFCARRHEELLPRRLIAPQVNQLLQVAQKCQNTISESGRDGLSQQAMQANSAMIVTAGRQLSRSLELQSLNDLGFSKRYVRCLQIAEVVNSLKDLMDFCDVNKVGPIEGLRTFPRHAKMQKLEEMALHSGPSNSSQDTAAAAAGRGGNLGQVAAYPSLMTRQNSINSIQQHQQEPPASPFSTSTTPIVTYQQSILQRTFPNSLNDCRRPIGNGSLQNQSQPQDLQQRVAMNKNTPSVVPNQQPVSVLNPVGFENSSSVTTGDGNKGQENIVENNNFPNDSNGESVAPPSCYNETCKNEESEEFPPGLCVPNDTIPDEIEDYSANGFLDSILDEETNFWK